MLSPPWAQRPGCCSEACHLAISWEPRPRNDGPQTRRGKLHEILVLTPATLPADARGLGRGAVTGAGGRGRGCQRGPRLRKAGADSDEGLRSERGAGDAGPGGSSSPSLLLESCLVLSSCRAFLIEGKRGEALNQRSELGTPPRSRGRPGAWP